MHTYPYIHLNGLCNENTKHKGKKNYIKIKFGKWKIRIALGTMVILLLFLSIMFHLPLQTVSLPLLFNQRSSLSMWSCPSLTSKTAERSRLTSTWISTTLWFGRWRHPLVMDRACTSMVVAMVSSLATDRALGFQKVISSTLNTGCSQSPVLIQKSSWWPGLRRCCRGGSPIALSPTWRAQTLSRYRDYTYNDSKVGGIM